MPDLLADQRVAGVFALILGELTLLVVLTALLVQWSGTDGTDEAARAVDQAMLARTRDSM